jgi:hypothetical protein
MQKLFGVDAITLMDWVRIIIVAATVFVMVEVEKYILSRREELDRKTPARLMGL